MTFEFALRATEVLLALALMQQSAEHLTGARDTRVLFAVRAGLCVLLLVGVFAPWVLLALCGHSVLVLRRFAGPYNGGSDRMSLLILYCLTLSHWLPSGVFSQAAFGYLSVQVILSYFISGQVKIINADWRSGRALRDVFQFSAYPVSQGLRGFADWPRLMWGASWAVMLFEIVFPLSLFSAPLLLGALFVAFAFHVANACLFGLNRFVWVWVASYPSILWLQDRLIFGNGTSG